MELLETYMSSDEKARLEPLAKFRKMVDKPVRMDVYQVGLRSYRRRLGTVGDGEAQSGKTTSLPIDDVYKGRLPDPDIDRDASLRIADMDLEGVDVNLMLPSGWLGGFTATPDVILEAAVLRAFNRWMHDYCAEYPARLGGVVALSCRSVEEAVREIERCAAERWAWGVFPYAPAGMPLDLPTLEPLWAAAEKHDLSVCLHTFTAAPPYAPGGLDNWDNVWLQRTAAHVWCGQRNMAALIGAGLFDRYPTLRIGVLEAGHGWLPQWVLRLEEQAERCGAWLPELKSSIGDYVRSGRYFQSIEISEGWPMTESVMDLLGDDILMYASDYPHGESWFPHSVDTVLGWGMPPERAEKVLWGNPTRFYPRAGFAA